jgi:hypothetical protein
MLISRAMERGCEGEDGMVRRKKEDPRIYTLKRIFDLLSWDWGGWKYYKLSMNRIPF